MYPANSQHASEVHTPTDQLKAPTAPLELIQRPTGGTSASIISIFVCSVFVGVPFFVVASLAICASFIVRRQTMKDDIESATLLVEFGAHTKFYQFPFRELHEFLLRYSAELRGAYRQMSRLCRLQLSHLLLLQLKASCKADGLGQAAHFPDVAFEQNEVGIANDVITRRFKSRWFQKQKMLSSSRCSWRRQGTWFAGKCCRLLHSLAMGRCC